MVYSCYLFAGEQPLNFGYQRLWGSIGYGPFVILAGWMVDTWSGNRTIKDYTPVFYLMAIMLTLDVLVSSRIQVSISLLLKILFNPGHDMIDLF